MLFTQKRSLLGNAPPLVIIMMMLKVALSQKILENFYIANINIPNHYPEQKI
jgi:hypothetical protein